MDKKNKNDKQTHYLSIGMCMGLSIGLAIGSAMGNISLGMCMGLGIGLCFGSALDNAKNAKADEDPADDHADE